MLSFQGPTMSTNSKIASQSFKGFSNDYFARWPSRGQYATLSRELTFKIENLEKDKYCQFWPDLFSRKNTQILGKWTKKNLQILQDVVKKNALVKVLKGQTGGSLWKSS